MNFIATLSVLLTAAILLLTIAGGSFQGLPFQFVVNLSAVFFYLAFALFVFFLVRPLVLTHLIARFVERVLALFGKNPHTCSRFRDQLLNWVRQYQSYITHYFRHEKVVLLWNILLTLILYLNKCLIAFVVLKGMGLQASLLQVISILLLIIFLLYFAPTPGASFIAEASTSALMSVIVPAPLLILFAFLWRFFTTYFGVLVGGVILLKELGRGIKWHVG